MDLMMMYGLIALSVLCISIAPKTLSLWKLGVVFLGKWLCFTGLNEAFYSPLDGISFFFLYTSAAYICFNISKRYNCETSGKVGVMYLISAVVSLAYSVSQRYAEFIVVANAVFIAQAITIIWEAFSRMKGQTPRNKNVRIKGKDRRANNRPLGPSRGAQYVVQ